jgi:hypothetical protein
MWSKPLRGFHLTWSQSNKPSLSQHLSILALAAKISTTDLLMLANNNAQNSLMGRGTYFNLI